MIRPEVQEESTMPNRWLRDSILASRTLAELSDFAERLYLTQIGEI